MRRFTHGGGRYLLGQSEAGYGIWVIGRESEDPVVNFPATEAGWNSAVRTFQQLEPMGRPIAQPPAQPTTPLPVPAYSAAPAYPPAGTYAPAPKNGMATAGGTLGIVGAVLSLIPFLGIALGLVLGILAIIFSSIGLGRVGPQATGKGLAITGVVLGILTVIFKLIPGVNIL